MRKQSGFNLMELLVVVAIIGILGSIGYSSYSGYVLEARRGEAATRLLQLAQSQEKFYLDNNAYATSVSALGFTSTTTNDGNYAITISNSTGNQDYVITATATSTGKQSADTSCAALVVDHKNQRTPTTCW